MGQPQQLVSLDEDYESAAAAQHYQPCLQSRIQSLLNAITRQYQMIKVVAKRMVQQQNKNNKLEPFEQVRVVIGLFLLCRR